MMKRNSILILLFCFNYLNSQELSKLKLISKNGNNELDIPFQKWELPNGLTLLIHEDHSDPIVQVHVTYHVGSSRESPGKSGFMTFI